VARARAEAPAQEAIADRAELARAAAEAAAARAEERAAERQRQWEARHGELARAKDEVAGQLQSVEARQSEAVRSTTAQRARWRDLLQILGDQREELAQAEREAAAGRGAAA